MRFRSGVGFFELAVDEPYAKFSNRSPPIEPHRAMKSITINGAIESGLQEFTGSIEVGKSADLVVLGASPFEVKPSEIKSIPVLETWLAGKRVQWD